MLRGEATAVLQANQLELGERSKRNGDVAVLVNEEIGIPEDEHEPHGSRGTQNID